MFAELEVEPPRVEKVIKSDPGRFEVELPVSVSGRKNKKGDVIGQRSSRPHVQAREVKARGCDVRLHEPARGNTGSMVDRHITVILAVPLRGDSKGDGEITYVLPNRSIPLVHYLIAIVLEDLAEIIQLWPSLVTRGAAKPILPRESGYPVSGRACGCQG